jgi:hypothetical protein
LRFGAGNWEIIQRELLPGKTPIQVKTLFKNLQSSRVPDNPVKELSSYLRQPLNNREISTLRDAIEHYGPQFDAISMFLLPHRTPAFLRKAWYQIQKKEEDQLRNYTKEIDFVEDEYPTPPSTPPLPITQNNPGVSVDHLGTNNLCTTPSQSSGMLILGIIPYSFYIANTIFFVIMSIQTKGDLQSDHCHALFRQDTLVLSPKTYNRPSSFSKISLENRSTMILPVNYMSPSNQDKFELFFPKNCTSSLDILEINTSKTVTYPLDICPGGPELESFSKKTLQTSNDIVSAKITPIMSQQLKDHFMLMKMNPSSAINLSSDPMNLSILLDDSESLFYGLCSSDSSSIRDIKDSPVKHSLKSDPELVSVPQNRLTIDHGLTYVKFEREEDRHILLTGRRHGNSLDAWSSLVASGIFSPDKSVVHVSARYCQLLSMMENSKAASNSSQP